MDFNLSEQAKFYQRLVATLDISVSPEIAAKLYLTALLAHEKGKEVSFSDLENVSETVSSEIKTEPAK